ncbi:hypothetical protein [Actinosynnema pretiosum]|uniref:Uncharacterized protein n=1 Tax=Actinosynnema pretiosum TaxID=42197 RepID=A0A290Z5L7_9PSEU|nr:hypothetical protein [Actinosynnema pretiosum]ATE54269.1 hypothetical protein CNX65_14010 [Actinosynnema pretiosum]
MVGGVAVSALTTADGRAGVQPVEVVGLNDDGKQEVASAVQAGFGGKYDGTVTGFLGVWSPDDIDVEAVAFEDVGHGAPDAQRPARRAVPAPVQGRRRERDRVPPPFYGL